MGIQHDDEVHNNPPSPGQKRDDRTWKARKMADRQRRRASSERPAEIGRFEAIDSMEGTWEDPSCTLAGWLLAVVESGPGDVSAASVMRAEEEGSER